jgi:hypothetical protein
MGCSFDQNEKPGGEAGLVGTSVQGLPALAVRCASASWGEKALAGNSMSSTRRVDQEPIELAGLLVRAAGEDEQRHEDDAHAGL